MFIVVWNQSTEYAMLGVVVGSLRISYEGSHDMWTLIMTLLVLTYMRLGIVFIVFNFK